MWVSRLVTVLEKSADPQEARCRDEEIAKSHLDVLDFPPRLHC
jgi:hypothetical protein